METLHFFVKNVLSSNVKRVYDIFLCDVDKISLGVGRGVLYLIV